MSENEAEHFMLREKRATRGTRMTALVGEAAEDDEAFWGHGIWQENESDNESYETEEEKPDVFDSDFNDSEDDGDDEEESGSDDEAPAKKRSNRYKDPTAGTKRPAASAALAGDGPPVRAPRPKQPRTVVADVDAGPRTLRESTKSKSVEASLAIVRRERENKVRSKPVERVKLLFDQKQMLTEALQTEEENAKWLAARKFQQEEKDSEEKARLKMDASRHKDFVRTHSRRGSIRTITFSSVDIFPTFFSAEEVKPPVQTCIITGLPARYKDPLTGHPYANLEAFRELRRRHAPGARSVFP